MSSPVLAADVIGKWLPGAQWSLEAGVENYRWRETDDDGRRLLTEQGPRFVYGASLSNLSRANDGVIYEIHLSGHWAEVDYDGQDSNGRFVGTVTDYAGWNGGIDGGYRFARLVEGTAVDVFAGLGVNDWRRDINGGVNSIGQAVSGFIEDYSVDYMRIGIGIAHNHSFPRGYLQMGFRRPLSISEQVQVSGEAIDLTPHNMASGFLSYRVFLGGSRAERLSGSYLKVYYAGYRMRKSERVDVGPNVVWQPRSDMDTLGIMLGYVY